MKLFEITQQSFSKSTTGSDVHDSMLRDPARAEQEGFELYTVDISPDQYIQACAQGFGISPQEVETSRKESGKVDKYAKLMQQGTTFPMPFIQYADSGFSQEGLHRAFAAKEIGINSIPVLVVKEL